MEDQDEKTLKDHEKMIEGLSFGQMYRTLWPILKNWPYDISHIQAINDLRNQVAHKKDVSSIDYKGRNPFDDADSFAQVFFDAWAVKKELGKFLHRKVIDPPRRVQGVL